jgi:hypothetical protein
MHDAVTLIKQFGKGALLSTTNIEHGYKNIPIHPADNELLGFAIGSEIYYDKTLPMGLSSVCNLFEQFSSALHWVAYEKLKIPGCVYLLDDLLLVGPPTLSICEGQLTLFLQFLDHVKVPIKHEKTIFPTTVLIFIGLELDTDAVEIRLPLDKLHKLRDKINYAKNRQKLTLQELQSLIGLLNFACAGVSPGRTYFRRLIDLTKGLKKPHHKRRLSKEARADLAAWSLFL